MEYKELPAAPTVPIGNPNRGEFVTDIGPYFGLDDGPMMRCGEWNMEIPLPLVWPVSAGELVIPATPVIMGVAPEFFLDPAPSLAAVSANSGPDSLPTDFDRSDGVPCSFSFANPATTSREEPEACRFTNEADDAACVNDWCAGLTSPVCDGAR